MSDLEIYEIDSPYIDYLSKFEEHLTLMKKIDEMPILEEHPTRPGFFKTPLQKEKLAIRENAIFVKKISGRYDYLENYWYEITMDDGHTLLMTISAVSPQDDGSIECYFFIRSFDYLCFQLKMFQTEILYMFPLPKKILSQSMRAKF